MASNMLKVLTMFSPHKNQEWRYFLKRMIGTRYKNIPRYFMLSLGGVNTMTSDSVLVEKTEHDNYEGLKTNSYFVDKNGKNQSTSNTMTFEPDDPRLRSSECLKNAAGLTVDSTSAVLSQTVYAIIDIERQYVELLNLLGALMEQQLQVLDLRDEEEIVAGLIVETRHEINNVSKRKQDLAILFASVKKLAEATAEVTFAAGADYASTSIGERLHSAESEVQRLQAVSEEAERNMQSISVRSIEAMSKHEQNKRKQEKSKSKQE